MAKKTYDLLFKLLLIGVSVAAGWAFATPYRTHKLNY